MPCFAVLDGVADVGLFSGKRPRLTAETIRPGMCTDDTARELRAMLAEVEVEVEVEAEVEGKARILRRKPDRATGAHQRDAKAVVRDEPDSHPSPKCHRFPASM